MSVRDDPVRWEVDGGVGTLTLDAPEKLNAFSLELARRCLALLDVAEADPAVRVLILRGAGRAFSAGGDVKQMASDIAAGDRDAYFREPLQAFGELALRLRGIRQPVVAAVHGAVAGVAFNLILSCDLIVAAESTRFTQAFISLGLSPDGGGTFLLPRLVGKARAAELTMLPTQIDAATACEWGLVNRVVPPAELDQAARDLAARLAAGPTEAIARAKALLNAADATVLAEQIEAERQAQLANSTHPDFAEGISAFVEKRPPRFTR